MGEAADSPYVPIACVIHEKLEFAVLRRQKLHLRVRDANGAETGLVVMPTDVATRNQAEWLGFRADDGTSGLLRLDRIVSVEPAV